MPPFEHIREEAIRVLGLQKRTLTGRAHAAVFLRHTLCLVLRRRGWPMRSIYPALGYKDHTTIVHAVAQMVAREKADPVYKARVAALRDYVVPEGAEGYNGEKRVSKHPLAYVPVGGRTVVAAPHTGNLRACIRRYGKRHGKLFTVTVDAVTKRALVTRTR